ncbi:DNA polymerase/3'-5' exonuclease PolX [Listeria grayi]|uniref:DNA polymerase/3'-5' exonuclease PolX n=1 Tax=Listeria grayi TaxID=1641 RepID=UPI0016267D5D|nr:DNA polymerase/3'-5' exonuclease PolX [Listeria grayi]MBC1920953.1 DNA polymerase/3'-5' exonuclease PolX [Listeria grayi]
MATTKKEVIQLLEKIAVYMELKGENPFKISAFRKAAQSLEMDDRSLSEIDEFTKLPGIGERTGEIITTFVETGESPELEQLQKEVPKGLIPLLDVQGLGGKKLSRLYKELGITDKDSLLKEAENGKIAALKGFGQKSVDKMVEAVREIGTRPERYPIYDALKIADQIEAYLDTIPAIETYSEAGSLRRLRETVKDLDFVIGTTDVEKVKTALLEFPLIQEVTNDGNTKVSVELKDEIEIAVDFRLVSPEDFPTTLHHFTGSKDHNIKMRQLAKEQDEKISEYGVENKAGENLHFKNESAFYDHFGLPYLPPEVRKDGQEIERIKRQSTFIEEKDIRGDLHMHTTWSDGAYSLPEMIEACIAKKYDYMVITDHGGFLKVANGLEKERLLDQVQKITTLKKEYPEIDIYAGVEMDILPDGTLDFEDDVLKELDFVIASIHSSFSQTEAQIMKRLETACKNPYVRLIAHPTGRIIGKRPGYQVNMEKLIQLAAETGTALELNANPQRLDLAAAHLEAAKAAGVKIAINTDAHDKKHLDFMKIGVRAAKKGWLEQGDILNSMTKQAFRQFIQNK